MLDFQRVILRDGKLYENVILGGAPPRVHEFAHVSRTQHRHDDAVRLGLPLAPHYDSKGRPCYTGMREIKKHEAAYKRAGYTMTYDSPNIGKGVKIK